MRRASRSWRSFAKAGTAGASGNSSSPPLPNASKVARDPAKLTWDDFFAAARKKGGVEWAGGRAPTSREMFPDVPTELMHDHDHGHGPHRHTHTHQHDDDDPSHS
jgi:hypothetical protein